MTIEPMPIRQSLPIVQPCNITECPTVTWSPMTSGEPSGLPGVLCDTWPIVRSWMLVPRPIEIWFTSPRSTVLHQTELSSPIFTSPMTWQEG